MLEIKHESIGDVKHVTTFDGCDLSVPCIVNKMLPVSTTQHMRRSDVLPLTSRRMSLTRERKAGVLNRCQALSRNN